MIYHTDRRELISRSEPIPVPLQIILDPIKILGIGSCRILTPLYKLYKSNKNIVIHNCLENFFEKQTFTGNNFLGKLHNSKEIIQFLKFLKNDIILPERILKLFLTGFSRFRCCLFETTSSVLFILNLWILCLKSCNLSIITWSTDSRIAWT